MDNYASGGIGAGAVVVLGILYRVYLAVNHHRVRSNCCGKELVVSVDVDEAPAGMSAQWLTSKPMRAPVLASMKPAVVPVPGH